MTAPPGTPAPPGAAKRRNKGLLLWIVLGGGCASCLVCGGLLTTIGVPTASKSKLRAESTEADANLRTLATLVQSYCEENGTLPPPAGPTPAMPMAHKQLGDFASDRGFSAVGFDPEDPVFFSYEMRAGPPGTLTLAARGDLDGDGVIGERTWKCQRHGARCTCTEMPTTESQRLE